MRSSGILAANADEGPVRAFSAFHRGHCGGGGRHGLALALAFATASHHAAESSAGSRARAGTCRKNLG